MAQAIGAFMVCALLITLAGATGWFERVMNRIPMPIASALLAGVLARFGMQAFLRRLQTALPLVLLMLLAYLLARRAAAAIRGADHAAGRGHRCWAAAVQCGRCARSRGAFCRWPCPSFTAPELQPWQALVSLALPLFVVTMASQNLPGVAVIRAAGYQMPISRIITHDRRGATLLLAPFGAFALNLSAPSPQPSAWAARRTPKIRHRRYTAAVACGLLYIVLIGLFGAAVTGCC
jgi:benzoate membrane transport protein